MRYLGPSHPRTKDREIMVVFCVYPPIIIITLFIVVFFYAAEGELV